MDALSRFKSVYQNGRVSPALLRAERRTPGAADVPLHLAAARLRPPPAPSDDDEEWDAVIARAKLRAEMPPTPPPTRRAPAETLAALNALVRRGQRG
jgi:hypothetical protein